MAERTSLLSARRDRQGYVLMVALILLALLAVIGATTLSVAGVDQRIANHNRKHMMVYNTSHAGTEHGRYDLMSEDPSGENLDSAGDSWPEWVSMSEGDTTYEGTTFDQNLGVYWVEAIYERCSNPPPGYSTELNRTSYRSDYWTLESTARMTDTSYANVNETSAASVATVRKVVRGACKIR